MNRLATLAAGAAALSVAFIALTGCGGGGSNSTPPPQAVITSFTSSPATIEAGSSAAITGVFSGGTGVITPGNISATSGVAVSVTPASTTTYTLTVTPDSGTAATQSTTITVDPVPTITSFAASPAGIAIGSSSSLTPVFANGTGVITPGNIAVVSGTPVTVTPTATTPYTLTVTPPVGPAITQMATVTVYPLPTIASFTALPPSIAPGGTSSLTATFANGAGVITPGNIAVTSGTPVSVTPSTTTPYLLTVTPPVGSAITQTVTVTVNPPPTITSFTAKPATITVGSSSSLSAIFANGTGVITPGNISVTSGLPVFVNPITTTQYTLTVTPSTGAPINQTTTVTVEPLPTITSFTANPATVITGQNSALTAVFANGTGVITPGPISVTSGTPVNVSPTATTTYTLTVTPPTGAALTQTVTVTLANSVTVDQASSGPPVTNKLIGMNLAMWYDPTTPAIQTGFAAMGVTAVRWPGGSNSDAYNWETNTECGGYSEPNSNFTTFVNDFVIPSGVDLALTADYGTGENCTGPGDPAEAASWAAQALTLGVTVSHMTVGNEEYGHWEIDNHAVQHDPPTYAAAVGNSTSNGYYQQIKTASPNTLVGVEVDAGASASDDSTAGWDPYVLANSQYDFVEYHFYPQGPGGESDAFLVHSAAQELTTGINTIKSELAAAGHPNTPIYVGEMGSVSSNPGKQSWSITQGLYAGQLLGEMMNDGVVARHLVDRFRQLQWHRLAGDQQISAPRSMAGRTLVLTTYSQTGLLTPPAREPVPSAPCLPLRLHISSSAKWPLVANRSSPHP